MSALTKKLVDQVANITRLDSSLVRHLFDDGWTFTYDIHQDFNWSKNGNQSNIEVLHFHKVIPTIIRDHIPEEYLKE